MKKLVLAGVLFSSVLGAQVNDYFVNNPDWVCYHGAYPWPCQIDDSINYYINGDSVINAMTYKVLYKRGHFMQGAQVPPGPCINMNYTYQDTFPTGFLRSQGMQMYFIPNEDSVEYLLYDFNLAIGSHLPLTYVNTDTTYTVTFIDSIYTAAGYRQRYFLNGNNFEFLIEGVGSSAGLLFPLGVLFEQTASLICYSQNDTAYWPSVGPGCSVITTVQSVIDIQELELVPNPATEYVDVHLNGLAIDQLQLYDSRGQLLMTQTTSRINTGILPAGIYFVRVFADDILVTEKLLIE